MPLTWRDASSITKFALGKPLSKQKYDILKGPNINKIAEYFNKERDFAKGLGFTILERV